MIQNKPNVLTVMAIINVTPDSFSDGGWFGGIESVVEVARQHLSEGATVLDVGGESTRPGAEAITIEAELARVIPVVRALREAFPMTPLSIDTRKSAVAKAAIEAGATIINDVSGLCFDPQMVQVAAETGVDLILMHSNGTPETMQQNPHYLNVTQEVKTFLARQADLAIATGVCSESIIVDPGFGFGKTVHHNMTLLRELSQIVALGYPVLVGLSRKSFLTLGNRQIVTSQREGLTAAANLLALQQGATWFRVHDPAMQVPVLRFYAEYQPNLNLN